MLLLQEQLFPTRCGDPRGGATEKREKIPAPSGRCTFSLLGRRITPSNGSSRLGMAIVFLEGGLSPTPKQIASAKLHRGPVAGMSIRRTEGLQTTKKAIHC